MTKARCATRIVFTVLALVPAALYVSRPGLTLDAIALALALAAPVPWVILVLGKIRRRKGIQYKPGEAADVTRTNQ